MRRVGAIVPLLALAVGCERPPKYPPDETHISAQKPEECFGCHHEGDGPPMHPSHFVDDSLKVERQVCFNCHEPDLELVEATR